MSNVQYFHGMLDRYQYRLGKWRVVSQEHQLVHEVQHARQIAYRFSGHVHPYAQRMMQELIAGDVEGLQKLDTEFPLRQVYFKDQYRPLKIISAPDPAALGEETVGVLAVAGGSTLPEAGLPVRDLDFDYQSGAYSVYNWEVFYHAPYTIALHLSKNGRHAEAQRWFHYIFDPTDNSDPAQGPRRFWKFRPFRIDEVEHIEEVLFNLATGDDPASRDATVRAIGAWRDSPFRPHLVARTRPTAYMYATVMAYLDNLIAWGDELFRQDTRESINEAMQLYVLAANILGPHPEPIPRTGSSRKQSYASLKQSLDEFGNAAVKLEAEIGFDLYPSPQGAQGNPADVMLQSIGRSLYFCVPRNDKFIGYWGTVADRLFKIRNSLNLQGIFRQLPLFAPPIDPAMMARAVAAGVDVSAIADGTAPPIGPVRFAYLLQRALEMAQEVKSLGGQVLAALEKKDGEALGVLRARHELNMLNLAESVRHAQWQEAVKAREGVQINIANAFQRYRHYERLLGADDSKIRMPEYQDFERDSFEARASALEEPVVDAADPKISLGLISGMNLDLPLIGEPPKLSREEEFELLLLEASQIGKDLGNGIGAIGAFLNLIPNIEGSVKPYGLGAGARYGGSNIGMLFNALSTVAKGVAERIGHDAGTVGKVGSYIRREQDWSFQRKAAAGELTQLFKQLRSAEIREYIAKREHEHHAQQIRQSQDVLEFLTNEENRRQGDQRKTTTEDFYLWMKREAQGLHAKCYQFAHEVARKAERAFEHELVAPGQTFIQSSYLAGREGLFAGERLQLDLKRMEMAYAQDNLREYEITRHVSLREWFPLQLIALRKDGQCSVDLPEALFDLDCPGHLMRRIKSVSLSIPCVAGPYTSVNCHLLLTRSHLRVGSGGYGVNPDDDTNNFRTYPGAVQDVVTSSAQNDNGMFEANLRDERYLPFEGAGVISTWNISLLGEPRPFDYDTIADVVLTVRYTARSGGNVAAAKAAAKTWLQGNSARVFSMRHEFPSEWAAFKRSGPGPASLRFTLIPGHFPYRMEKITAHPQRVHLFFAGNPGGDMALHKDNQPAPLQVVNAVSGTEIASSALRTSGDYELKFESNALDDLWLVVDWAAGG